jgi:membrane-associated protease RseP (regulator of RpoE activity)
MPVASDSKPSASCRPGGEDQAPEVPARISLRGAAFAVILFAMVLAIYPQERFWRLFLAFAIVSWIHVLALAAVGTLCGIAPVRIALFYGGSIVRARIGNTWMTVGWLPLGGYAKFRDKESGRHSTDARLFFECHPLLRAAIALSGLTAAFVISAICLGLSAALANVVEAPRQLFQVLQGPSPSAVLIGFLHFIDHASFWSLVGVVAAKLVMLNLSPLSVVNGGQVLEYLVEWVIGRPIPERTRNVLGIWSFLVLVLLAIFFAAALVAAWRAG